MEEATLELTNKEIDFLRSLLGWHVAGSGRGAKIAEGVLDKLNSLSDTPSQPLKTKQSESISESILYLV